MHHKILNGQEYKEKNAALYHYFVVVQQCIQNKIYSTKSVLCHKHTSLDYKVIKEVEGSARHSAGDHLLSPDPPRIWSICSL